MTERVPSSSRSSFSRAPARTAPTAAPTKTKTAERPFAPPPAVRPQAQTPAHAPSSQAPNSAPMATPFPQQSGGMMSGLGGALVQGMAMGTGSAIAHRAVDAVAGPRQMEVVHKDEAASVAPMAAAAGTFAASSSSSFGFCGDEESRFQRCLTQNNSNMSACRSFFDILSKCQQDNKSM